MLSSENNLFPSTKTRMSAFNKTNCIHKQKGSIRYVGGSESKWAVRLFTVMWDSNLESPRNVLANNPQLSENKSAA